MSTAPSVGIVAAGIREHRNRAIGNTLDGSLKKLTVHACHVVVVEAILDFFGDALLGAVIVMDLHDEPDLLAFGGGAAGGTGACLEVGHGIEHRDRVVAKLHSLTGAIADFDGLGLDLGLGLSSCHRSKGG